ncbi:hypothetical protein D3C76_1782480 [compost metagenome]
MVVVTQRKGEYVLILRLEFRELRHLTHDVSAVGVVVCCVLVLNPLARRLLGICQ